MEYFIVPRYPFDIDTNPDPKFNKDALNNPKDFIMWVADRQPSTYFDHNKKIHCHSGAYRSLDDIYHLVNKRWPMSEETFLILVGECYKGDHSFQTYWDEGAKLFLYFNFCYIIRRVVVHTSVFKAGKNAHIWASYKSFCNPRYIKPDLKDYLLKYF